MLVIMPKRRNYDYLLKKHMMYLTFNIDHSRIQEVCLFFYFICSTQAHYHILYAISNHHQQGDSYKDDITANCSGVTNHAQLLLLPFRAPAQDLQLMQTNNSKSG